MKPPDITANSGFTTPIRMINWDDNLPVHDTELHLVRCNYQAYAVAFNLAKTGKIYGGLYGWSAEELNLANAIIAFRSEKPLSVKY